MVVGELAGRLGGPRLGFDTRRSRPRLRLPPLADETGGSIERGLTFGDGCRGREEAEIERGGFGLSDLGRERPVADGVSGLAPEGLELCFDFGDEIGDADEIFGG